MEWVFIGIAVALIVTRVLVSGAENRRIQARTRRHLEAGGKLGDAPDVTPPHGGGAAGA